MSTKQDAIVLQQPAASPTPMTMLQIAVEQNWDLDKLSRLMDLSERWEANEARKAFDAALAKFKANPPDLYKNKTVAYGTTKYKHATLDEVASKIGEAMAPHGLSFRWNVQQDGAKIRVTCILSHVAGHSESVQLEAPPDNSGQKNSIQQVGSTITYLQRYSLLAATGMAVQDESDNDGRTVPSEHFKALLASISKAETMDDLARCYKAAYKQAQESKDKDFMAQVIAAKDDRKAALSRQDEPSDPVSPDYFSEDGVIDCQILDVRAVAEVKNATTGKVNKAAHVSILTNGPDGENMLFCWHQHLFAVLSSAKKYDRAIFDVKQSGKFWNIEDVRSIAGKPFKDGQPLDPMMIQESDEELF